MAKSPVYELAISLPFRIDDFGAIATTVSQEKIWADRARSAVGTYLSERVYRSDYGTVIPDNLFGKVDLMMASIEEEVEVAFTRDLPLLSLQSVETSYSSQVDTIYAEVSYLLPNKDQTSISIGIARISTNKPIVEELL
jgi:phage baseplate assembly protein W